MLPELKVEHQVKNKHYTLVLDLDETLVHTIPKTENINEWVVKVRPGAKDFIKEMSKYYELVIFTIGTKDYADYALKFVDPEDLIQYKLYREHATQKGMSFIKDISKLGRDLRKVIIIDNIAENFQLQANNGIYINTWEDDENDTSLIDLMPMLKKLVEMKINDVRIGLRYYRDQQLRKLLSKVLK